MTCFIPPSCISGLCPLWSRFMGSLGRCCADIQSQRCSSSTVNKLSLDHGESRDEKSPPEICPARVKAVRTTAEADEGPDRAPQVGILRAGKASGASVQAPAAMSIQLEQASGERPGCHWARRMRRSRLRCNRCSSSRASVRDAATWEADLLSKPSTWISRALVAAFRSERRRFRAVWAWLCGLLRPAGSLPVTEWYCWGFRPGQHLSN
jgi:hypothetical protein